VTASTQAPPAGWFFIADHGAYRETGVVISVFGGGALFCRCRGEHHRLIFPDKYVHWEFFETEAELSAAMDRGQE